jgi:cystathionine gamma-synthase
MNTDAGLSTRCVHGCEIRDAEGSPHTPIYTTTIFKFSSTADLLDVVEGRKAGNLYTRYGSNPTIHALEEKLAALEEADSALAFSSGMAAISALFFAYGRKGIVCIGDAYGGTLELLSTQLPLLCVKLSSLSNALIAGLAENLPSLQIGHCGSPWRAVEMSALHR